MLREGLKAAALSNDIWGGDSPRQPDELRQSPDYKRVGSLRDRSDSSNPKIITINVYGCHSSDCVAQELPLSHHNCGMRAEIHFAVLHLLGCGLLQSGIPKWA